MSNDNQWDLPHLHDHLKWAVALEFWTIPFYMAAMYSIKTPAENAYQLIQSVVNQEMLHVQLAANVANAFGVDLTEPATEEPKAPSFDAPQYGGPIPHLDFGVDPDHPTRRFQPWSSAIGPLDLERINAMCLIEYPEWAPPPNNEFKESLSAYGSIGEFYRAVAFGAEQLKDHIQGGRNQVDYFGPYYEEFDHMTVTESGAAGFEQVAYLIEAIVEQGEGQSDRYTEIPPDFRNTADDPAAVLDHFDKFVSIRDGGSFPAVYPADPPSGGPLHKTQQLLLDNFTTFRGSLEKLFSGVVVSDFHVQMTTLGGNILACWKQGLTPVFSEPTT